MKFLVLWAAMLTASLAQAADPIPFPEYDAPHAKYLETLAKAHGANDPRLAPLNRTYAERLEQLRQSMTASGDTAGVAAVVAEQERVKKGVDPTSAERGAIPGLLRVQRTSYEKERFMAAPPDFAAEAKADAEWKSQLEPLYRKLLNPLQADKSTSAKAAIVKAELDRVTAKLATPPPPPPPPKPVATTTTSKPDPVAPPPKPAKPSIHPGTKGIASEESRTKAEAMVKKLKLKNSAAATESEDVLAKAASHDLDLLQDATGVALVSVHDAAKEPMKHNSGDEVKLRGSWADKVILGGNSGIMFWGPYETLETGRYLVVYRFKIRGEVKSDCFLDVAYKGETLAGSHPKPSGADAKEWLNLAVPVTCTKARALEYRMWPGHNEVALDRVYIYRLEVPL